MAFNAIAGVVGVSVPTQAANTLTDGTYTTAYPLSNGQTLTFTTPTYHPLREVQILTANTGGTITGGTIATNAGDSISMGTVTCDGTWKSFVFPQHSVFNSLVLTFTTVSSAAIVSIKTLNITEEFSHESQQLASRAASNIDVDTKFLAQYTLTGTESLFGYANTAANKARIVSAGGPWGGPYIATQTTTLARTNLVGTDFNLSAPGNWTTTGSPKLIKGLWYTSCYAWGLQQRLNATFESQPFSLANSTSYTLSFIISSELPAANLYVEVVRVTGSGAVTQLSTDIGTLGYSTLSQVKALTTTFTSSADAVGSTYKLQFRQHAVTGSASFKSFLVANIQLETGTYATAFNSAATTTPNNLRLVYSNPVQFLGNSKDFTISMWMKPEVPTAAINRAVWVFGSGANDRIRCYISSLGEPQIVYKRGANADANITASGSGFNPAVWNHWTVCFCKYGTLGPGRSALEIYLNGVLVVAGGTQAGLPDTWAWTELNLGENTFGSAFQPQIYYSGVRIDQRVLSPSEIESLANQSGPYMPKGVHRIAQ